MSNIFNLLGGITESGRGQVMKPLGQSEISHDIKLNSFKAMGGAKPKGLSIRSHSDMNICHSTHSVNIKKNTEDNKEQDRLKLKVTQIDNVGCPISPGKETKKLFAQPSKFKEPLKETTMINKSTKAQLNEGIFKKPLPSKKNIKQFPKPEKLAYWHDGQHKFDYEYVEIIEKEFKDLFSKEKENIKPSKEKELMPESPILLEVPKLAFDRAFDEEHKFLFHDLPEISDISDDDL